ncbi:MAG: Tim44 domain-containing protein [Bacteroidales bacterium]|nr:Tim44 domain-containing protein [Bacteroidales bacterium]
MNIKSRKLVFLLTLILFVIFIFVLADPAMARPGGGNSYSGGGSGGGGGGGGDGIGILIYLIFSLLPPYISIPLVIIILIGYSIYKKKHANSSNQVVSKPTYAAVSQNVQTIQQKIHNLLNIDPNFSRVLFLDFVSSLYVKFHAYKYSPQKLTTINPFIDKSIIASFASKTSKTIINEIVIGSINISQINQTANGTQILVEINSNYTATTDGKSTRYIISERWMFERAAGVVSVPPEKMHKLSCPSCGAPADFNDAGQCGHCGTLIVPGSMQWMLKNRAIVYSDTVKTNSLLSYAPEVGTNYPTIFSPTLNAEKQHFASAHGTTWEEYWSIFYHKISTKYFMEIYNYWTNLKWNETRHLLTDRLWESYNFWIDEYKRNAFQNRLDDTKIIKIHLAKIETDNFYEAITVRIYASAKDYVVDKNGKVLAGNAKTPRIFSEYWTFIRRKGVENDDYDMKTCPNCGAPADKINQGGQCEYCGAKITSGDFSWVLAMIIQDEEYKG